MKWKQVTTKRLESDPLTHIIQKIPAGDGWQYQAIRLGKRWSGVNPDRGWDGSVSLLMWSSAAEAKAACEADISTSRP